MKKITILSIVTASLLLYWVWTGEKLENYPIGRKPGLKTSRQRTSIKTA